MRHRDVIDGPVETNQEELMADQSKRDELLAQFGQTGDVIRDFVASRTADQRNEQGTHDLWAAKDVLALVAFWMDYTVERMGFYARGTEPPREVDFDAVQAAALKASYGRSWKETAADTDRARAELVATVGQFTDTQLEADNYYGEGPGGPLWGEVQANGFIWPLQELEKYLRRVGEGAQADHIQALLAPVIGEEEETIVCEHVAPETLETWLREGSSGQADPPLVIDVRGKADYARGHLHGALHIPLAKLPERLKRLPHDRPIVTYCNMHHPGQSRGERAAALLSGEGFQALAIDGGFTAWEAHGLPIETTGQGEA
jgi:rhodanese-related sulfurtransferase